ncbi:MAG: sugar ABC transporter ATP-binding protein [Planctomycetes bacterium]|nr:sugar ABC transporter ATP-binding protein [Planctomycetota bacterium]
MLLECRGISKRFGGSAALDGVDFELPAGSAHGLVGSNGAGKSTLMRILAGALPSFEGRVVIDGRPADLSSPRAASRHGIAMVHQELSGIGSLSVAENLFLGRQPVDRFGRVRWGLMRATAAAYLAEMGIDIDVRRRLDSCPLVLRQMVEIARGIHSGARILILDEPTSALSPPETRGLFGLLRELRRRGVAMVYISHFIEDVLDICDRVTVLRDGRRVGTFDAGAMTKHSIVHAMLGRNVEDEEAGYERAMELPERSAGPTVLDARGLTREPFFREISLQVAAGECVGLYGFVGAGHQELAHALAGALRPRTGQVRLEDRSVPLGDTHAAVRRGLVLVAADRAATLVRSAPIFMNVTLAHLRSAVGAWITRAKEIRAALPVLDRVGCVPREPTRPVRSLSGGNQQKVVLAKWLLGPIRALVMDEPTRGMDVGAKQEVLKLVRELRDQGAGVLIASTEPELLLAHCDRILVMRRGTIVREFAGESVDRGQLLRSA